MKGDFLMRIKMKILIPVIAVTLVIAATILISNVALFSNYVDKQLANEVIASAIIAENRLDVLKTQAKIASMYLSENDGIIDAIINNNRDVLLDRATKLQNETGMEFCTITSPDGTVILRSHEPENYGDSIASQANIQSAMAGKSLTTLEKGSAVRLSVRSGSPILDGFGNMVGIVSVGFRLDTDSFVDTVKEMSGAESTVFLGDERIATTVLKEDGTRAIGTKADEHVSETVLAGNSYRGQTPILGREAIGDYAPITGPDGEVLGMLFVGHYLDETTGTIWSFIQSGLLIVIVLLVVAIVIILLVVRRIVTPIRAMVDAAFALASGDTDMDIRVNTKDEMRDLADAFNAMIENIRRQVQVIEHIAEGDLSVSVVSRSEKDSINNALIAMLKRNNGIFSNIADSANHVSAGASQVADGAQTLAQRATEQAASIGELSGSIAEISERTKENSDRAGQAARLADSIKSSAEKGSRQMDEMMTAVQDINQSSQDIGKVIKVIDDIAFQTNILALNAAVEAARAGQHGKGFAVVADEVRNLAAKSADAAKDTEDLIATSMKRAELGVRIAGETSASLDEIVSGINESSRLVAEIAGSSEEQFAAISQINTGIDQVAGIVRQNSATAEESAAASEEMSSLSAVLQQLVSQFKLKDESAMRRGLPEDESRRRSLPKKSGLALSDAHGGYGG
jgi:methyl-accepting chemotaxis protein